MQTRGALFPDWPALWRTMPEWRVLDGAVAKERLAGHGDFARWHAALDALPDLEVGEVVLGDRVTARARTSAAEREELERALGTLHPWRKGPWSICGVEIDTEWRSDWKWRRLAPHLGALSGQRVLDVGCGNGYFGWRLLEAGADQVMGVDPTLVFYLQHLAVSRYLGRGRNWLLPLKFEDLPPAVFDTVLSMGVVYHRRDPVAHIERLLAFTRPGGRVVVESLVVQSDQDLAPAGRYARMRNVHLVPRPETLCAWLVEAGATDIELADVTPTTTEEQHSTRWMHFESLAQALDPGDPARTVEGHPAPVRAIVLARRPT